MRSTNCAKGRQTEATTPLMLVKEELSKIAYSRRRRPHRGRALHSGKVARSKAVDALKAEVKTAILEKYPEATPFEISQAFDYLQKKAFRVSILDKKIRCDGSSSGRFANSAAEVGSASAFAWQRAFSTGRNAGRRPRDSRSGR